MRVRRIKHLTVEYSLPADKRFALAEESLPWIIAIHPRVIEEHRYRPDGRFHPAKVGFFYRLFEFPEGTSNNQVVSYMRKWGWAPADPAHMLAFAAGGFKKMPSFPYGTWHHYVVGLGGTLHTVLGSQFGGMNSGTTFFFQHVPQDKPMHRGGRGVRFLAIKEKQI